jgi:hypothetical protein
MSASEGFEEKIKKYSEIVAKLEASTMVSGVELEDMDSDSEDTDSELEDTELEDTEDTE